MNKTLIITTGIIASGLLIYFFVMPRVFVSMGRGPVGPDSVKIQAVTVGPSATGDLGKEVLASEGNKFVHLDLVIKAAFKDIDVYDFQLVKGKASKIGEEQNVGDNMADNAFFWSSPDTEETSAKEIRVRLSFQVPKQARQGYLFYWGEYFGPVEFGG